MNFFDLLFLELLFLPLVAPYEREFSEIKIKNLSAMLEIFKNFSPSTALINF
jgi:hypothetical protein